MAITLSNLQADVTDEYLDSLDLDNLPSSTEIQDDLVRLTNNKIILRNAAVDKNTTKWSTYSDLSPYQIARVICKLHDVCVISFTDDALDAVSKDIGIYQDSGYNEGLYVTDIDAIESLILSYNGRMSDKEIQMTLKFIRHFSETKLRCSDPDLIPVNNGIFNYKTKILMSFSSEYVFTTKSRIDYVPRPKNPVIHNNDDNTDWDVESWINELTDDSEIVELLWQILGALIRPNVSWNKALWFYSEKGNNGKGTFCHLMRNLCGDGFHTSIALSNLHKDSLLEKLTRVSAIITDENDVGTFIDKAAHLKEIVTGDVITIDRKYRTSLSFRFKGIMVQCINEMPRVKDKSDSFYRRCMLVPFEKCFTGVERKYIKDDYLDRKDVLEYVLNKVLNTDYYEFSEPQACASILDEYKGFNDPLRQFAEEILPQCQWGLLPWTFLYDLYKAWFKENVPTGSPQGSRTFTMGMKELVGTMDDWDATDASLYATKYITGPEPLIAEYNLTKWMNSIYRGADVNQICTPSNLKDHYRGLVKI